MRHTLGYLRHNYRSGSLRYVLDERDGALDARLAPGVHDLLYSRGYDYSSSTAHGSSSGASRLASLCGGACEGPSRY